MTSGEHLLLQLATRGDAPAIAGMSRDLIERGLGWSWTRSRVMRSIDDAATNVVVAREGGTRLVGFGVMTYQEDEAHLLLLAVRPVAIRRGVCRALVGWLEAAAIAAGIERIYLEARAGNAGGRAFYRRLGYREIQHLPGYYQGEEPAVRFGKDLWSAASTDAGG